MVFVTARIDGESPIDEARGWVDDDDAWATAVQSGETLAEIAGVLRADAASAGCADDAPELSTTCAARYRVAAWAEVSAVAVLRCTRPGVFAVRGDARAALDAVAAGAGPTEPPPLVDCD